MRNLRLTLVLPAVAIALYVPFHAQAPYVLLATQLVCFTGCLLATTSFTPGDYLRRAWALFTVGQLLFVPFAALNALGELRAVQVALMLSANVVLPAGAYLFGAAWSRVGMELPAGRWTRRSGMAAGFVVGCLVGGPALFGELAAALRDGNLQMLAEAFGTLADIATVTFTAPILLTALALRGGH